MYQSFTINSNDAGQRLDKFISKSVKALPRSMLYKALRTKKIKVNRKRAEPGLKLVVGDLVELYLKDDFFSDNAADDSFKTLTPKIDVVYEDVNIIVCNKSPGIIVHSDDNEDVNTLINHIKAYLYRKGDFLPESESSFAPALCNRIDRNTGGLVIAAKNASALRFINEEIKNNQITKQYICAVHGIPKIKSQTLYGYMIKDADANLVTVYKDKPQSGDFRTMITKYRTLSEKDGNALLSVELVTGRTHQIRAHLASIGHPLLGDGKYGVNRDDRKLGYQYQALYSCFIKFNRSIDDSPEFAYLSGKEISLPNEQIWFYENFL